MRTWSGVIIVAYQTSPLRILLLENKGSGKITCPGGAIENNENGITAGVRELKEEVGWTIQPKNLIPTGIKHEFTYGSNKPEREGDSASNEIFLLDASTLPPPIETIDARNAVWYEEEEALQKMSFREVSELVRSALTRIPGHKP